MLWVGVPVGLLAAALLQANNLRDIATDTESGKKTLAVRLGRRRAGLFYCFTLMGVALAIGILLQLPAVVAARPRWRCRWPSLPSGWRSATQEGRALLPMLGTTARLQMLVGALLTIGLLL